ncbi:MAG: ABC transporter permease [Bacteroidia bacterium]
MASALSAFHLAHLSWRLLLGQGLRRQRLIFFLHITSIALGAGSALLILTLFDSFQRAIVGYLYDAVGALWVRAYGEEQESRPLPIEKPYVRALAGSSVRAEPAIHLPVLLQGKGERYEGVQLISVAPSWWQGRWAEWVRPLPQAWVGEGKIVISRKLSQRLNLQLGDKATVVWLADPPRLRRLTVVGLYEARLDEIDRQIAFVPLELGQRLLGWDSTQIQIGHLFVQSSQDLDQLAEALSQRIPITYEITPLTAIFPDIFDWLGLIRQNVQLILLLVGAVSFFTVAAAFLVLQMAQRLRYEVCAALGARSWQLWSLALYQALFSVAIGVGLGAGLVSLFLLSQQVWEWVRLDPENYLLSTLPVYWNWRAYGYVGGGALGLAVLLTAVAYPYRRVVRILSQVE